MNPQHLLDLYNQSQLAGIGQEGFSRTSQFTSPELGSIFPTFEGDRLAGFNRFSGTPEINEFYALDQSGNVGPGERYQQQNGLDWGFMLPIGAALGAAFLPGMLGGGAAGVGELGSTLADFGFGGGAASDFAMSGLGGLESIGGVMPGFGELGSGTFGLGSGGLDLSAGFGSGYGQLGSGTFGLGTPGFSATGLGESAFAGLGANPFSASGGEGLFGGLSNLGGNPLSSIGQMFGGGGGGGNGFGGLANIGTGLYDLFGSGGMSMQGIAQRAAMAADPFSQQRGLYQPMLYNLITNPGSFNLSPAAQAQMSLGMQGLERSNAAKGFLGSGNMLAELQGYGQKLASQDYYNQLDRLSALSGATTGSPAAAGQTLAGLYSGRNQALGDIGAGISAGGLGGIGNMIGGIGSMIGGLFGG